MMKKHSSTHKRTTVLSVRLSPQEWVLLEAASDPARTNVSDIVRRKALDAAERDMQERRIFTIPATKWGAFENWASQPGKVISALREVSAHSPTWEA